MDSGRKVIAVVRRNGVLRVEGIQCGVRIPAYPVNISQYASCHRCGNGYQEKTDNAGGRAVYIAVEKHSTTKIKRFYGVIGGALSIVGKTITFAKVPA